MVRFLCVGVLFYLSVVRGSNYGSARNVVDLLLAERSKIDTHADVHLVKRGQAADLARRARNVVGDDEDRFIGKSSNDNMAKNFPDPYVGKPGDIKPFPKATVVDDFNVLLTRLQSCQRTINANQILNDPVTKETHQVVVQFEKALYTFQHCPPCSAGPDIKSFESEFTKVFSALTALFESCRKFSKDLGGFLKDHFGDIDRSLADFLTFCQTKSLDVNTFIPKTFGQFVLPAGFTYTQKALQQAGYKGLTGSTM